VPEVPVHVPNVFEQKFVSLFFVQVREQEDQAETGDQGSGNDNILVWG
jgi:hypothetical protein